MKPSLNNKIVSTCLLGIGITVGSYIGYQLLNNPEKREQIIRSFQDIFDTSKRKVMAMSEDIAIKTAQMTNNPKVNQDWVAQQWESVGY